MSKSLRGITIPALLVVSSILLGTIGFREYWNGLQGMNSATSGARWLDAFYHAVGLPILQTVALPPAGADGNPPTPPLSLEIARGLGVLSFAYAIGFAAMLFLGRHLRIWYWRLTRGIGFLSKGGHAVVCGLGWKGRELVEDLLLKGFRVLAVDVDESLSSWAEERGAHFVHGDSREAGVLRRAGIRHAGRVFVVCANDDSALQTVRQCAEIAAEMWGRSAPLIVDAHFRRRSLLPVLPLASDVCPGTRKQGANLIARGFLTERSTARALFHQYPLETPASPENGPGATRLVVIGDQALAPEILVQAARIGHVDSAVFPDLVWFSEDAGVRARFSADYPVYQSPSPEDGIIRPSAEWSWALPTIRCKPLLLDGLGRQTNASGLAEKLGPNDALTVVVAVDDGPLSLSLITALGPELAREIAGRGVRTRILFYFNSPDKDYRGSMQTALRSAFAGIETILFSDFGGGCTVAAIDAAPLDDLARLLNLSYCEPEFFKEARGHEALRRASLLWTKETNETDKFFSRSAADHIAVKCRAVGVDPSILFEKSGNKSDLEKVLADLDARLAEVRDLMGIIEHRRWVADHLLEGFRHHPVRIKEERLHPCMVHWEDLTAVQDDHRTAGGALYYQRQASRMAGNITGLLRKAVEAASRKRSR